MASPNIPPSQGLQALQATGSPLISTMTQRKASNFNGKKALNLEGISFPRPERLFSINVCEGETGEDGVIIGGILNIKARHSSLAQEFLTRKNGTNLAIPQEVSLKLPKVLHE